MTNQLSQGLQPHSVKSNAATADPVGAALERGAPGTSKQQAR